MLLSFRVQNNSHEAIEVKEFHVNLWYITYKKVYLDLGIWFEIPLHIFFAQSPLEFTITTPFPIKKKVDNLFDKLKVPEILRLVHNDYSQKSSIQQKNGGAVESVRFDDESRGSFLLFNSQIKKQSNSKITLILENEGLNKKTLEDNKLIVVKNGIEYIGVYNRFRYEVKISDSSNIYLLSSAFTKKLFIDLRINDLRSDDASTSASKFLKIKKMLFYAVLPRSYETIDGRGTRKYVRTLEQKWRNYIPPINPKDNYLVHSWKEINIDTDSYIVLISAKREVNNFRVLFVLLCFFAILFFLVDIWQKLQLDADYNAYSEIVNWILRGILALLLLITTLIGGNALWDFIKLCASKVWNWYNSDSEKN